MTFQLAWLDGMSLQFPETSRALQEPNGLLAAGGDLSVGRLLCAYQQGIFPWFSAGQPLLWWTPNPRMVLVPRAVHINRSLRKLSKKRLFRITVDQAFDQVIQACAEPRTVEGEVETGTWITPEICRAYCELHSKGFAHCVEAWQDDQLVGGLYGVALGKVFFGESMFSRVSGASKIAFATLAQQLTQWEYQLIDCQLDSQYLASFGAKSISRMEFEDKLRQYIPRDVQQHWQNSNFSPPDWRLNWSKPEYGFG